MNRRIVFKNKKDRDLFFDLALKSFGFSNWSQLDDYLSISRQMLSKYRSGMLTLPFSIYQKILLKLPSDEVTYFSTHIKFFEENWGRVKGGEITYSKYPAVFEEGRRKGIEIFKSKVHHFNINRKLDWKLAYFIGLFIGDGFTNKYCRYYITQFVGHKKDELIYYEKVIFSFSKALFGFVPKINYCGDSNFIRVNFYSKDLFLLLTKRFGISRGKKSSSVLIPKEILNSSSKIILACIAGIYDAEGCVFVDRRPRYKVPYIRMDLHMINPPLIRQISSILSKERIQRSVNKDYSRILVYGSKSVRDFVKKVKIINPKHVHKLEKYYEKDLYNDASLPYRLETTS